MSDAPSQRMVSSICAECGADLQFELGQGQVRCASCDAGLAINDGLLVRLDCPACRGNFYYIDGTMCSRCPYCGVGLLALTRHRVLRYAIAPAAPQPDPRAALQLVPFWRLNALSLGWDYGSRTQLRTDDTVAYDENGQALPSATREDSGPLKSFRGRVIDVTLPDPSALALGIASLRLRATVFPAAPLTAAHELQGKVLPTTLAIDVAREALYARGLTHGAALDGMQLDCQRIDLAAETLSVLLYPFWVREGVGPQAPAVWDGVNGEPEQLLTPTPMPTAGGGAAFDDLHVIELVCGECRHPLPRGNHSVIFPCAGCGRFWVNTGAELAPFVARWARPAFSHPRPPLWLPFWRLQTRIRFNGRDVATVGDLRRVLNVMQPRVETALEPAEAPLRYFVSAYGNLRAPRLDFAARDLTRLQPRLEEAEGETRGATFHCFFGPEDALRLRYATWLQIITAAAPRMVRSLRVSAGEASLWYLPFGERGRELVNLISGVSYDRAVFGGVGH